MKKTIVQFSFITLLLSHTIFILTIERLSRGTESILNFVKPLLPENPIILEAGPYNGDDTRKIAQFWTKGKIYAFEPVPQIFALLEKKTSMLKNVVRFPFALSNKKGKQIFFISEYTDNPGIAGASGSLLPPAEHTIREKDVVFTKQIAVSTQTIDLWAKENNISRIDFMWLDMQGHELNALKRATTILSSVKLIYTEVEFAKAYKDQPLFNDIKVWMESQGFSIIALDFDEKLASQKTIPVGERYYGNALFINNKLNKIR